MEADRPIGRRRFAHRVALDRQAADHGDAASVKQLVPDAAEDRSEMITSSGYKCRHKPI
jgi:hypothetical protein